MGWAAKQQGPPIEYIVVQELDRFGHQREFEVVSVLDLCGREKKVDGPVAAGPDLYDVALEINRCEVLNADRRVKQQLDCERRLNQLCLT